MEYFEYLKLLREQRRLSIEEVSNKLNLDSREYLLLENNKKDIPFKMINNFCRVFNVDFKNFIDKRSSLDNLFDTEHVFNAEFYIKYLEKNKDKLSSSKIDYFNINNLSIENFINLKKILSQDLFYLYYGKKDKTKKNKKDSYFLVLLIIFLTVALLLYIEYQLNIFGLFEDYYH